MSLCIRNWYQLAQEEHPGSLCAILAEALDASCVTVMVLDLHPQVGPRFSNSVKLSAARRNFVCAVYLS